VDHVQIVRRGQQYLPTVFEAVAHRSCRSAPTSRPPNHDPQVQSVNPSDARLVTTWAALRRAGVSSAAVRAQLAAGRWRRLGHAIAIVRCPDRTICT